MNIHTIEQDQNARLQWAFSEATKKDSLPDPHGKGVIYIAEFRHGRVALKAFKAIAEGHVVPGRRNHRVIRSPYLYVTKEGERMMDGTVKPITVKDRVHHHFELYP